MSLDLLGIFGAGALTFLTPCVLPLIPIYLSALIGADIRKADAGQRGQLMVRALFFIVGFVSVFTFLGMAASSIGAFLIEHKAAVQVVGAAIILIFGLKFLGLVQISFLDQVVQGNDRKIQTRFGWINAIIMGIVFAAGWSPCAGPVLGSVLTYTASTTTSPWVGAGYLAVYGLGFGVPLLLVAAFAEAGTRMLKRIGPHLGRVERAMGFLLIMVAGTLFFSAVTPAVSAGQQETSTAELVRNEQGQAEPTMVIFTSSKCSVCQTMKPLLVSLTQLCHGKKVLIREFDLAQAEHRPLIPKYRLVGTPTFLFLDDQGREVARLIGEQTENTLKQALSAIRGIPCPGVQLIDPSVGDASGSDIPFPDVSEQNAAGCETKPAPEKPTEQTPEESCQ